MRAVKLLTALTIAGMTSVAFAKPIPIEPSDYERPQPRETYGERYDGVERNVYDRDRYARWQASRYVRERWIPLMRFSDADNGRQYIPVDARGGWLDMLRIEADLGTPLIKRIMVEYLNGSREIIRIDSTLSRGHGQVIDLRGDRRVHRIVVVTDPRFDGLYSIYGT